jgi:VWFA-related protein
MFRRPSVCRSLVSALVAAPLLAWSGVRAQDPAPQERAQFRAGVTLVPVDVRVLDGNRQPVTDLTAADFTVIEDGRRQDIRHFSAHSLVAEAPDPDAMLLLRNPRATELAPQNHRVFLLVLGRGRLQGPAKGVDAMRDFVAERLLPQDQVAVLAWNRATDFTTDHDGVLAVIDRFEEDHEDIESRLASMLGGLAGVYGTRGIPAEVQGRIDAVFDGPDGPGMRQLAQADPADAGRIAGDTRRVTDLLLATEQLDSFGADTVETLDISFDDYVSDAVQTSQDLTNLYTGIEYLRHIEGEKHLVFVTENGLFLPRLENDTSLAAVANDARVVIDTIHTGGLPPPRAGRGGGRGGGRAGPRLPGLSWEQRFAVNTLRTVSRLTGGLSSAFVQASTGVDRIADATSFQYLLGYYPTNDTWDGRYRSITVRVNRPGVTVLYRHGYYGSQSLPPLNRQQVLTYSRISAAGNYDRPVTDIRIDLEAGFDEDAGEVVLELTIDPSRFGLIESGGRHAGTVELALFVGDSRESLVGELWQTLDLKLLDATYRRYLETGLPHTARIPVRGQPEYVKAIVYDPTADLVGSMIARLR